MIMGQKITRVPSYNGIRFITHKNCMPLLIIAVYRTHVTLFINLVNGLTQWESLHSSVDGAPGRSQVQILLKIQIFSLILGRTEHCWQSANTLVWNITKSMGRMWAECSADYSQQKPNSWPTDKQQYLLGTVLHFYPSLSINSLYLRYIYEIEHTFPLVHQYHIFDRFLVAGALCIASLSYHQSQSSHKSTWMAGRSEFHS